MQSSLFDKDEREVPLPVPPGRMAVQHNALVNARFDLSTVEARLFTAMLARIERDDNEFREMSIPLTEIIAISGRRPSSKDYNLVGAMCDQLLARILYIERPIENGSGRRGRRKTANPDYDKLSLLESAKYRGREGILLVRFSNQVLPYLLQLHQNFTQAQVEHLFKLKSPHSYRIYWLLKEYATFGSRTVGVEELKRMLNLEGKYEQFPLFRIRVLDRAQQELSKTDLPFEYELIRDAKPVTRIKFIFKPLLALSDSNVLALPMEAEWQQTLQGLGMAASSLATIQELVEQGGVTPDYIRFVVKTQQEKHLAGKIKSVAGAVFTAITKQHLLADYTAQQQPRRSTTRPVTRPARHRDKLLTELEDARKSLDFVVNSGTYSPEKLPEAEAEVRGVIARLEGELKNT